MNVTLYRLDTFQPFIANAVEQSNSDGSVSYALPSGGFGGQAPGQYGVRNDNPEAKQYQRAKPDGNFVTFTPEAAFPTAPYLRVVGQVFPA